MAKPVRDYEITALRKAIDELQERQARAENPSPVAQGRRRKKEQRMQQMADNFLKYNKRR